MFRLTQWQTSGRLCGSRWMYTNCKNRLHVEWEEVHSNRTRPRGSDLRRRSMMTSSNWSFVSVSAALTSFPGNDLKTCTTSSDPTTVRSATWVSPEIRWRSKNHQRLSDGSGIDSCIEGQAQQPASRDRAGPLQSRISLLTDLKTADRWCMFGQKCDSVLIMGSFRWAAQVSC